jgi:protein disulfide-isomerase A1
MDVIILLLFVIFANFILCVFCVTFQDATANDIPSETFEVQGYPTLYFRSASGKISQYDGGRTKEDIIEFIEKNKDKPAAAQQEAEQPKAAAQHEKEQPKDEL